MRQCAWGAYTVLGLPKQCEFVAAFRTIEGFLICEACAREYQPGGKVFTEDEYQERLAHAETREMLK